MTGLLWVLPGREGWVRLEANGNAVRPVALCVGGHGGAIASLSVRELAALRDGLSAVLEGWMLTAWWCGCAPNSTTTRGSHGLPAAAGSGVTQTVSVYS